LFTEPLRVGAGLVATDFALERENLGGLLPSETKKQFKKVLDPKAGIHSSYEPCSAVSAGLNLTRTAEVRIICSP
jgi:hypothetical protein